MSFAPRPPRARSDCAVSTLVRLGASLALVCAALTTPSSAFAALTPGALRLDANFHTIGVRAGFTTADAAAGNAAVVEYRRPGEPAWRTAPPAWLDVRSTLVYAGGAANWARCRSAPRGVA